MESRGMILWSGDGNTAPHGAETWITKLQMFNGREKTSNYVALFKRHRLPYCNRQLLRVSYFKFVRLSQNILGQNTSIF